MTELTIFSIDQPHRMRCAEPDMPSVVINTTTSTAGSDTESATPVLPGEEEREESRVSRR